MVEQEIYWFGAIVVLFPLIRVRRWGFDEWIKWAVWISLWTVILSHAWHILIGEASVTDYTDGDDFFALFGSGIAFELDLDNPWLNTYEFTVALELLILKAIAGFYFLSIYGPEKESAYLLGIGLLIDAVLSFLLYGFTPDITFQSLDLIGLILSTFWLSWGWSLIEQDGDGWLLRGDNFRW
tara:strand:+ start:562 stop:1107 length:546 start_codon:yes stop_codon:yes gene_type:complete